MSSMDDGAAQGASPNPAAQVGTPPGTTMFAQWAAQSPWGQQAGGWQPPSGQPQGGWG